MLMRAGWRRRKRSASPAPQMMEEVNRKYLSLALRAVHGGAWHHIR